MLREYSARTYSGRFISPKNKSNYKMETVLINCLIRNNEKYIPYMIRMFKSLENKGTYNLKYLIYTNDNDDRSNELLKNSKLENLKLIDDDIADNIKKMERVERLYHLREKLLRLTLKEDFDYLLMLDSDIFFNYRILEETVNRLKNTNFEAITTNTLYGPLYPFIFYYDNFSLINKEGKPFSYEGSEGMSMKKILNFLKFMVVDTSFSKDTRKVISSFAGFFLIQRKTLMKNKITYLDNIEKNKCEHIDFNKNFNIGLATDINPLRLEGIENESKYQKYMDIIMKNRYDNRGYTQLILILCVVIVIFVLIILYRKFTKS